MAPIISKGLHESNVERRAKHSGEAYACKRNIRGSRELYLTRASAECNNRALVIKCGDGKVEAGAKSVHETCKNGTNRGTNDTASEDANDKREHTGNRTDEDTCVVWYMVYEEWCREGGDRCCDRHANTPETGDASEHGVRCGCYDHGR